MTSIPIGSDFIDSQCEDDFLSVGNFSEITNQLIMSKKVYSTYNVMDLEQQDNKTRSQQPNSEDESINSEEDKQRLSPRNHSGLKGRRFTYQPYDERRIR